MNDRPQRPAAEVVKLIHKLTRNGVDVADRQAKARGRKNLAGFYRMHRKLSYHTFLNRGPDPRKLFDVGPAERKKRTAKHTTTEKTAAPSTFNQPNLF